MATDIYDRKIDDNGESNDSLMPNDDEQTKQVVKILKEVRSNLSEHGKGYLDDEVKQVTKECTERREQSLRAIEDIKSNFENVGAVTLGLNLETTLQITGIFLLCWNKQGLAETIMKEIYGEDVDEESEVYEPIPAEIIEMDTLYAKALNQGFENVKRIRLMVVGMFSVGKTLLVNNLVEDLSKKNAQQVQFPPSTEGIDVHLCLIDGQNKWKKRAFAKRKVGQDAEEQPTPPVVNDFEQIKQRVVERQHVPEVKEVILELEKHKIEPKSDEVDAQKAVITGKEPLVSVWDFAGQNLYYLTHHFFLNKRSIYLLLMDMTKDLNTNIEENDSLSGLLNKNITCLEAFKFWLNSIHIYNSSHDQEHEVRPTVILVGTHKDEMKCKEEEKEYKMEEFFTDALESFMNNEEILKHIHEKKFLVNNIAEGDPVFDKLRAEVKMLAEQQHYWNEKSPTSFVQLEKSLDTMRAEGKELVSLSDVKVANMKNLKPVDELLLHLFLESQHMFGNILHFDTAELKKYVILAPQWITEAFKCFITHKPKKDLEPELLQLWKEYKDYAIIKPILMKEIIRRSKDRIRIHGKAVVQYMEYLNIMSKPVENYGEEEEDGEMMATDYFDSKTNAVGIPSYNSKMHDFHIVPCQLKAKPKERKIEELICPQNWETTPALCFVFKDKIMPLAVFHRLLAACIRGWEIAKQINDGKKEPLLFNGIGGFKICKRSQLRLWYCDHIIYARMIFMRLQKQETEEAIDGCICQRVRRQLYRHLMAILGQLPRSKYITKTTPFEEYIQCPNLNKHDRGLFRVNDFIIDGNMSCSDDHDVNDAHSIAKETVLQCWYPDVLEEMKTDKDDNMGDLNRVPEDSELSEIASGLEGSKECWLLGIELGISQPTMEQLKRDHWNESRSVFIYHVLYEWKHSQGKYATLSSLKRKVFAFHRNSDFYPGSIFRCFGTRNQDVDNQIPTEANGLDENKLGMIAKALGEGYERVQRIRAMVVGMFAVGKTSLVNNLIDTSKNKSPPHDNDEQYPQSTVGIDVHLCKIENEKWKKLAFTPKRNIRRRIENSIEKYDNLYEDTTVEKQEETQEEKTDVGEQTEENAHVNVCSPDNVPDQNEKLKIYIEQDEIEIAKTAHTTANEGIKVKTDTHENPPLVSVWDFAGQNLYYSTHHFFFNKRSIYLLVMNMTKELDDVVEESKSVAGLVHEHFTSLDIFKFWLNSINMYSSIRDQEQECKPTVILIGTHRDQMKGSEKQKEDKMHTFFNEALSHFPDRSILKHVNFTKFLVNNLDARNPVFDEIRNEVKKLAEDQPYWNEKYPLKWIQLEKTFEQMREQGKVIVKLRDVEAANGVNPEPLGGDELQLFLEMQHMYGNILYFDSEELKNHVMLSPQWTIEAFKCFISHKEKHVPPTLVNEWKMYKESAILEPQLLKAILDHSDPQIKENADVVVEYMKHLDIMAKPIHLEDYEEQYEEGQKDHNGFVDANYRGSICTPLHSCSNFHILPCLLNAKPEGNWEEMKNPPNWHNTKAVCFVFKNNFMPRSIFHRLLAACIRNWEIAKLKGKRLLYNGFGVFKVKQAQLRIWYDDHIIYARMSFMSKHKHKRQAIDPGVCGDVRRTLYMNLMAILSHLPRSNDFTKTTPFEEYVQCPKLNKHNCGLFRVNDLLQDVELICGDDHENIQHHTMQIDKYWYSDILTKMKKEETIFEGVNLDIVPTNQHLTTIALCLRKNKEIWLLGIELGLRQVDMERIRKDNPDSKVEFIFHVLSEWKQKKNETLKKLKQAFGAVMKNSPGDIFEIFAALKE